MRSVTVIIPVKKINNYVRETIPHLLALDYTDFDIIIFPDVPADESFPKTTIVATGSMGPAEKRDLAIKYAMGDIIAFIDDDAYPKRDWLKNAVHHFDDPNVGAVGGPAVTPPSDSFLQRVSGAVFLSKLGGGFPERYWPLGGIREVDDWPSVNLLVRKDIFKQVGGFNSEYWPGEDTKLCLDIIKLGKKIIYNPDVFVWHHRRKGLIKHLRQVGRYGLHRGFFARKYPETSRKLQYFIPSLFVLFLFSSAIVYALNITTLERFFYYSSIGYFLALAVGFFQILQKERNIAVSTISTAYIFLTHVWYGIKFLQGYLLTGDLKSKLR